MHHELGVVLPGLWVVFLVNVLFRDQLNNAVQAANTTSPNTRAGLQLQQQLARQANRNQQHADGEESLQGSYTCAVCAHSFKTFLTLELTLCVRSWPIPGRASPAAASCSRRTTTSRGLCR